MIFLWEEERPERRACRVPGSPQRSAGWGPAQAMPRTSVGLAACLHQFLGVAVWLQGEEFRCRLTRVSGMGDGMWHVCHLYFSW